MDERLGEPVVAEQLAVWISSNEQGYIVIEQENYPQNNDMITVAPHNAMALAQAIMREAGHSEPLALSAPVGSDKATSAAERQRRCRQRKRDKCDAVTVNGHMESRAI